MSQPECPACGDVLFGMPVAEVEEHIIKCATSIPDETIAAYFEVVRSKMDTERPAHWWVCQDCGRTALSAITPKGCLCGPSATFRPSARRPNR